MLFRRFDVVGGAARRNAEQFGQCARFLLRVASRGTIETGHAMPAVATLVVDRLIRGDGVQPGPHLPARLELIALQVDLQERLLKDVGGHVGVAEVMPQIAVQFLLVAVNQFLEHPVVGLGTIAQQELLIAPGDQRVRATGTQSPLFNRALHT